MRFLMARVASWTLLGLCLIFALEQRCKASSADFYAGVQYGGFLRASDGNYYGSTTIGPISTGGTIYRITPSGRIRIVHTFFDLRYAPRPGTWGAIPRGNLILGPDNALYGVTQEGGVFGFGTIFRVATSGRITHLHYNEGPSNLGLLTAAGDKLYSILYYYLPPFPILRLSRDGTSKTISLPEAPSSMLVTADGKLVVGGGTYTFTTKAGHLWRLNEQEEFESFADVGSSSRSLVELPDGGVIGYTDNKLFKASAEGTVTILHEFTVPFEGLNPSELSLAVDGSYLGRTSEGGLLGKGVSFRFSPATNEYSILSHGVSEGSSLQSWLKFTFLPRVAPAGTNRSPLAKDDIVPATKLKVSGASGGLPSASIAALKNDTDADRDALEILSVAVPAHGTATRAEDGRSITYTSASAEVENDTFSYTISDGQGGKATAWVFIRTNPAGQYTGSVVPKTEGGTNQAIGTLSLKMNAARTFSARLTVDGKTRSITGRFNEWNKFGKLLPSNRETGESSAIQFLLRPDGAKWIVEAVVSKGYLRFEAICSLVPSSVRSLP